MEHIDERAPPVTDCDDTSSGASEHQPVKRPRGRPPLGIVLDKAGQQAFKNLQMQERRVIHKELRRKHAEELAAKQRVIDEQEMKLHVMQSKLQLTERDAARLLRYEDLYLRSEKRNQELEAMLLSERVAHRNQLSELMKTL